MNKELQIGQRVRLSESSYWVNKSLGNNPVDQSGTVIGFTVIGWVIVDWDVGCDNTYRPTDSDLIPVEATADGALETLV